MGDEAEFNFDDWATEHKLSRKTTAALNKDECNNLMALKLATVKDVNRMDVPVGQIRILRQALRALGNTITVEDAVTGGQVENKAKESAQGPTDNLGMLIQANQDLNELLGVGGASTSNTGLPDESASSEDGKSGPEEVSGLGTTTLAAAVGREPVGLNQLLKTLKVTTPVTSALHDPLTLLTVKATTTKALRILDFLPEAVRSRVSRRRKEQVTFSTLADGAVALRAEEAGHYYVSIDEWSGANVRLAAQLVKDGQLKVNHLLYYMAYTALVSDLAAKYEWQSVLEFDSKYRELQAEYQFQWGTPHPHTERYHLIPKRPIVNGKGKFNGGSEKTKTKDRPLCRDYIRGLCDFGSGCRYRHERPTGEEKGGAKNE